MKGYKLFIDDLRTPPSASWYVARNSDQAIRTLLSLGCPSEISFDHDLGGEDTAMKVVHWLIDQDMNNQGQFIPPDFQYLVHSANPVGKANIEGLLSGYLKHKSQMP